MGNGESGKANDAGNRLRAPALKAAMPFMAIAFDCSATAPALLSTAVPDAVLPSPSICLLITSLIPRKLAKSRVLPALRLRAAAPPSSVGEAFMPDAVRYVTAFNSRTAGQSIAAEAASYKKAKGIATEGSSLSGRLKPLPTEEPMASFVSWLNFEANRVKSSLFWVASGRRRDVIKRQPIHGVVPPAFVQSSCIAAIHAIHGNTPAIARQCSCVAGNYAIHDHT